MSVQKCYNCGFLGHSTIDCTEKRGGGGGSGGEHYGGGPTCYNCNQVGHISRECPEERRGGGGGGGGGRTITCYNCQKEGHMSRDCPEKRGGGGGGRGGRYGGGAPWCSNCHQVGHVSRQCPEEHRPRDVSTWVCFNCSKIGHIAIHCPLKTASGGLHSLDSMVRAPDGHPQLPKWTEELRVKQVVQEALKNHRCPACHKMGHLRTDCTEKPKVAPAVKTKVTPKFQHRFDYRLRMFGNCASGGGNDASDTTEMDQPGHSRDCPPTIPTATTSTAMK